MVQEIKEVNALIKKGAFEEAESKIKVVFKSLNFEDTSTIEQIFSSLIFVMPNLKDLYKYFKVDNVPALPLSTDSLDSRKFFYYLYLLNKQGGKRLVSPYLENIMISRPMELRFLGGMHFFNIEYEKAASSYEKAKNLINNNFSPYQHSTILGNLAASYLYNGDIENYERVKNESLKMTNNHLYIRQIFIKYDVQKSIQIKDFDNARKMNQYLRENNYYRDSFRKDENIVFSAFSSAIEKDTKKFRDSLITLVDHFKTSIKNNYISPERFFNVYAYISKITIHKPEVYEDIFKLKYSDYPFYQFKLMGSIFHEKEFTFTGSRNAKNYLNFITEEYEINGNKGINLNIELKAIYWLVRSKDFGLSFETLASLIYDNTDLAGLFLIKERIKQIVHRLKNTYKLDLSIKNNRIYISNKDISQIYLTEIDQLRIKNQFSLNEFMNFYKASNSKARKVIRKLLNNNLITKSTVGRKNFYTKNYPGR